MTISFGDCAGKNVQFLIGFTPGAASVSYTGAECVGTFSFALASGSTNGNNYYFTNVTDNATLTISRLSSTARFAYWYTLN